MAAQSTARLIRHKQHESTSFKVKHEEGPTKWPTECLISMSFTIQMLSKTQKSGFPTCIYYSIQSFLAVLIVVASPEKSWNNNEGL